MNRLKLLLLLLLAPLTHSAAGQTIDDCIADGFAPSTVRETYEICRYTDLSPDQQVLVAQSIESENALFVELLRADGGVLSAKSRAKLAKVREKHLAKVMDRAQLEQYYRGIFDSEAEAEAQQVRTQVDKQLGLSYQEGKFVYAAFYRIGLGTRVAGQLMKDTPRKAAAAIEKIRTEELAKLESKSGIRIDNAMQARRTVAYSSYTPLVK